ncbi:cell division protein FtsZ [Candidatus Fermentibacteria bacterium]|nr:cell division protein FtsZ [Candidatus Fermentibacteria bacterium]
MAVIELKEIGEETSGRAILKVVGVGGCGGNAINRMIRSNLTGVDYVAVNTDCQALEGCLADTQVQIGPRVTRGLGAGGNAEVGEQAAEESIKEVEESIEGSHMVFIAAGMGGGTGTGAAPVMAKVARDAGAITVGVVTRPFEFEGTVKANQAEHGIEALRKDVDTLIVIPNDRLHALADPEASLQSVFDMANMVLLNAVEGISSLISSPGLINLDFQDVKNVITQGGGAMMGSGKATGQSRAVEAAREAISSPLLDSVSIEGSKALLVSILSSSKIRFSEFTEVMHTITGVVGNQANVFMGSSINEEMGEELKVTVISTGFGEIPASEPEEIEISVDEEMDFPYAKGRSGQEREQAPIITQGPNPKVETKHPRIPPFLRRTVD